MAEDALSILRIATDVYPEDLGGGALHVHAMSRDQVDCGHEVTLLTSDHGNRSRPRRERREGYEIRRYRQFGKPFGNSLTPGMVPAIRRLARCHDVVHAHSHLYFSTNVAAALARITETPLIITNHGLYSQSAPPWLQRIFLRTIGRLTFNGADRVLCYHDTDRKRLRGLGVSSPIDVVHNGIDCDRFRPVDGIDEHEQLLYVGRLKETKGVRTIIEAFASLADEFPELSLTFVGDGPLREDLVEWARDLNVRGRVEFAGQLDNEDLPSYYTESALFVLPSRNEGLPRTVLESLACETPVVTSDLPQLEALVDGAGEMVPVADPQALAEVAGELLRDPDRRSEMGRTGRERVVNSYSWTETVRETTALYRDLIETGQSYH